MKASSINFSVIFLFFVIFSILLLSANSLLAVEDQFTISQVVGPSDVTAPSAPTSLVATAISTSQINLSWDASTDDYGVTSYKIYRDTVEVGSVSLTSFSDTGLSPSTLYSYTVTALDAALNESLHSATSSATTFAVTVTPPIETGTEDSGGGLVGISLLSLFVQPDFYKAVINFETNLYTRADLFWGETPDYEIGGLSGSIYLTEHVVVIPNLKPDTNYYFKIELTDPYGRKKTLENQEFKTLTLPDNIPPANVRNLRAYADEKYITLEWDNPEVDFDSVRIVRSDKFYPRDLFDGKVVYEGSEEIFVDKNVVDGKIYYYSVFAKDGFGNFSSGAITQARLQRPGAPPKIPDFFENLMQLAESQVHPLIAKLSLLDLRFVQDGIELPVVKDVVKIKGDRNLKIFVDYEKLPEVLKTIAISIKDPEDPTKIFSFLLRVNEDKTAYEAIIAPFGISGEYKFNASILDYKNQGLKKMSGILIASMPELYTSSPDVGNIARAILGNKIIFIPLLIILLILLFVLSKRRSRKQKQ